MEIQTSTPYRKMLLTAVSSILLETDFKVAEREVLETLTEMLQCFLSEIACTSRNYMELSGRTEPIIGDVVLGFVDMGINISTISDYTKGQKHTILPNLQVQTQPKQLNMLKAGTKHPLPSHIPSHLPCFPDPHAYIRTPTHKQPVIDYEAIREKFAVQKRDVEKALTKFLAKTSQTHNLFENDEFIFPLISCKPSFPTYINALIPQDQIFDAEDLEYKSEELHVVAPKKRVKTEDAGNKTDVKKEPDNMDDDDDDEDETEPATEVKTEMAEPQSPVDIDNPYLAATKMPNKMND